MVQQEVAVLLLTLALAVDPVLAAAERENWTSGNAHRAHDQLIVAGAENAATSHDHGVHRPHGAPAVDEAAADKRTSLPASSRASLRRIYDVYGALHDALARDDLERTRAAYADFSDSIPKIEIVTGDGHSPTPWTELRPGLSSYASLGRDATTLTEARTVFAGLSEEMTKLASHFGSPDREAVLQTYCPMALDGKGAVWLQRGESIRNPYLGQGMLACGEIQKRFSGVLPGHSHP